MRALTPPDLPRLPVHSACPLQWVPSFVSAHLSTILVWLRAFCLADLGVKALKSLLGCGHCRFLAVGSSQINHLKGTL